MAKVGKDEIEPPVTDFGPSGPVRCIRCKAYMCSLMQFIDGGTYLLTYLSFFSKTDFIEHYSFCKLNSKIFKSIWIFVIKIMYHLKNGSIVIQQLYILSFGKQISKLFF